MRSLWSSMSGCFGHLWTSAYSEDASGETGLLWAHGLAGIAWAKIQKGIEFATKSKNTHPPTLPQFRAWCVSDGEESLEPTDEEIRALAGRNENADRAYFTTRNSDWAMTCPGAPLFNLAACIYTRSRYLSDAEKTLRTRR